MNINELIELAEVAQALKEGKTVQYLNVEQWVVLEPDHVFLPELYSYRVKPNTKKYRLYLNKYPGGQVTMNVVEQGQGETFDIENKSIFLRWIHFDWQEVEI